MRNALICSTAARLARARRVTCLWLPSNTSSIPHYRALILRKTYADLSLPGAIMDRAISLVGRRGGREIQLLPIRRATDRRFSIRGLRLQHGRLWGGSQAAAVREASRLVMFGVLSPLGRLVESELQEKLEDTVTLSWQELRDSDLSGRARAFQSMVGRRYGSRPGRCRGWPHG